MREILPLLRSTSLFTGLTEEETESLLSALHGEKRAFEREEFLLRAGKPVRAFGVLLSGGAMVRQEDSGATRTSCPLCIRGTALPRPSPVCPARR